ncbi:zinc-dependent alcohol dehydrogenase family protein [Pedosphaera parvula]|uniref:Alcohol dehydrogenase zinc-binding domain protein n=1 Tax=Pedosphaera parvula (strain Ellin514) TaxID=320771 RepID=B9XB39_PEDPL|nr:NAD(P)-dependent alcohol dehydrogenase [Pedosphaera parvula]EEF62724.1 Alcohol dehydrogenase zinc-binding domain protein [Pedosphaera parvula Ellin514]
MKAFEIQKFGLESLAMAERPMPKPAAGQALVKMRAVSLNFRDLMMVKGHYNPKLKMPLVPLSDGVGEVVEVGPGAKRVKVGDRVCGIFMQRWLAGGVSDEVADSALGGAINGVAAEYVLFDEDGLVQVPKHLTDEEAATLPCAAVTAWNAVMVSGRVKAGDTVLLQGTGGVSLFALQFAKLHNARVIITSSSDDKLERAKKLGADELINYKTTPDWEEKARGLTHKTGVDHIVEVGGAGTLAKSLRAVCAGGHIALIGVLTGGGEVNPIPILMKSVRVQGIYVGSREMFEAMNRAIEQSQLRPVVDKVFRFEELPQALKYMETGAHFGKIVVKIS